MRIVTARRFAQGFFLLLFFWFCWVTTLGERWWELSGWPVNWLLQLDPLAGLATVLAARTLYAGLLWGAATLVLTLVLGRFFCGWICPYGALQQAAGYLSARGRKLSAKIRANRYRRAQGLKYGILAFLLAAAGADLVAHLLRLAGAAPLAFLGLAAAAAALGWIALRTRFVGHRWTAALGAALAAGVFAAALFPAAGPWLHAASVQTGLLDPIPLAHRAVNLTIIPLFQGDLAGAAAETRHYPGAWLIGSLFWGGLIGALWIPRFYCRFVCPLGALFGVVGRLAPLRIGKKETRCRSCLRCESHCEGGCTPSATIRTAECVLCMNCMDRCSTGNIGYRPRSSATGETASVDLSRRAFAASVVSGLLTVPMVRLSAATASNWPARRVRPPGALDEDRFLRRCIKCGQCMRVCPTNVIQPAGLQAGIEGVWTPVLNFRIGTSGCQVNCVACGHVCPTAAIRPLSLDERRGRGTWAEKGPIRIGTAFVDRGRCLPWAMDRPCIVCQENCPVSPKAIRVTEKFQPLSYGAAAVVRAGTVYVEGDFSDAAAEERPYGSGDYYCLLPGSEPRRIVSFGASRLQIAPDDPWPAPPPLGSEVSIAVRLQFPRVDPGRCIGCGICEHECPVQGLRAIRVTAENETRDPKHAVIAKRG
jgi:polyferredoxin